MFQKTFIGSVAAACVAVMMSFSDSKAENLGNIMPMGDSITLGVGSTAGGWR